MGEDDLSDTSGEIGVFAVGNEGGVEAANSEKTAGDLAVEKMFDVGAQEKHKTNQRKEAENGAPSMRILNAYC